MSLTEQYKNAISNHRRLVRRFRERMIANETMVKVYTAQLRAFRKKGTKV